VFERGDRAQDFARRNSTNRCHSSFAIDIDAACPFIVEDSRIRQKSNGASIDHPRHFSAADEECTTGGDFERCRMEGARELATLGDPCQREFIGLAREIGLGRRVLIRCELTAARKGKSREEFQ
jgi:hypothetical protein